MDNTTDTVEVQLEEVDVETDAITPGPGTYNVEFRQTGFKRATKDEKYQFFGSTVERFSEVNRKLKQTRDVGPGTYDAKEAANG